MVKGFYNDLRRAKEAEKIAYEVFNRLTLNLLFEDVSDERQYYHKGDLKIWDITNLYKEDLFMDVKDDSVIHRTKNLFAEESVFYKENNSLQNGFMKNSTYDYIAYMSKSEKKIYLLDFKKWQECYKMGIYKEMFHKYQNSYGYLMKLNQAIELGVVLATINYEETNGAYYPISVIMNDNIIINEAYYLFSTMNNYSKSA
ncbi:MAG: hypothetical protein II309_05475 [Bacilli bacterium]|nr:hypothetical protein [Bacilli bacterium]